jgi:hypothetical protein
VNGTVADANTIASNNAATKTVVNGNIDNANMAAAAAVAVTKLATGGAGQVLGTLAGVNTWLGGLGQIADSTAGGAVASFDFTSIPGTYAHLLVMCSLRGDTAATSAAVQARFNNDSAANYDDQRLTGSAAVPASAEALAATSATVGICPANTATANYFGGLCAFIPKYASTTGNKIFVAPFAYWIGTSGGNGVVGVGSGQWRTAGTAITRLTLLPSAGNFVAGSRATLYGLG